MTGPDISFHETSEKSSPARLREGELEGEGNLEAASSSQKIPPPFVPPPAGGRGDEGLSDIGTSGLLLRLLPESWKPYALLMRLDRPIGTWLLLLPGLWAIALAGGGREWRLMLLFAAGAVIMRGAGCVVNDLWDRDLDRQVARTAARPLAAGTVTPRRAMVLLAALLFLGLLILLQLPRAAILLGGLSLPFIAVYPLMKRITWWPQAFLGLTFNFGALIGWAAATGGIALPALLLYAAGFFWTLGYDTIYAHQDIADDAAIGIKSSARRLGEKSKAAVALFYALCWLLLAAAFLAAHAGPVSLLALPAALLHLIWQLKTWTPDNPASALKIFRSNRDFGLIVWGIAFFSI